MHKLTSRDWALIVVVAALLFSAFLLYAKPANADDSIESDPQVVEILQDIEESAPTADDMTATPLEPASCAKLCYEQSKQWLGEATDTIGEKWKEYFHEEPVEEASTDTEHEVVDGDLGNGQPAPALEDG